jgi:hypothetical protein
MHKWRHVADGDEGHTTYQCLACKQFIPVVQNYCCHCGIKWEGQHECRPPHVPAWAWRLWAGESESRYYRWHNSLCRPMPLRLAIEVRTVWFGQDGEPDRTTNWGDVESLDSDAGIVAENGNNHSHELWRRFTRYGDGFEVSVGEYVATEYRFAAYTRTGRAYSREATYTLVRATPAFRRSITAAESVR